MRQDQGSSQQLCSRGPLLHRWRRQQKRKEGGGCIPLYQLSAFQRTAVRVGWVAAGAYLLWTMHRRQLDRNCSW
jgi:hypothetical protein